MNIQDLGNQLHLFRKQQKLTLKDLGTRSGVHWVTLSRFENGYGELGVRKLARVAQALGLELALKKCNEGYTLDDLARETIARQSTASETRRSRNRGSA